MCAMPNSTASQRTPESLTSSFHTVWLICAPTPTDAIPPPQIGGESYVIRKDFHRADIGRGHGSARLARGAGICTQRRHADRLETRPLSALDEAADRNHRGAAAERHRLS